MAAEKKLPILLYWKSRTLAEPIRLMLAHLEVAYEDRRMEVGPPPVYDKSEWHMYKKELRRTRMSFPNLPLWDDVEGGVLLSQTNAIMDYIAHRYGMPCADAKERARAHMTMEAVREWLRDFYKITYCNYPWNDGFEDGVHVEGQHQALPSPGFEKKRANYIAEDIPRYVAAFTAELERNHGPWITGANLTYADFALAECLDQHVIFHPALLSHPSLAQLRLWYERFFALPKIAAYRNSDRFSAEPLHNRYSHFHTGWVKAPGDA
mmetsp:Transcript_17959/g.50644  ORF Transcript_17959/g.50644 Transcript_17959/m.50644 type:complete len:265 (+) Transcript_17959:113-907(+)|eukprot:CAMPEP_0119121498 /NCGR_PEP_ID=MMETSP1310-20130426/2104_1 /TAXON_ID=464262 /ORGANISM="Genus nov. species nov., Strain RCC2339" /LENGTH=264 /DNA_ID=CAMNT_0007111065 /DNA_START=85 /DNA_END=879 /DNA_ORIENTATION=+